MNCRSFAVVLLAFVGLVPALQSETVGASTNRPATATATILPIATNEGMSAKTRKTASSRVIVKYIGQDGHVTIAETKYAQKIIILDLP